MKQDKILSLLGLARKAGKIKSGNELCLEAVRKRECMLVIIASDASQGSRKKIEDKCRYRNIPCLVYADRESLGQCLGQEQRSCAAICDRGFAQAVLEQFGNMNTI